MPLNPVIAFGQQPCGFFPRRFLFAKIQTAKRLRAELGGEIVFFVHDSDHDPRETRTLVRHRATNELAILNFAVENKIQRKYSPLFLKRLAPGWQARTGSQLPNYVDRRLIAIFEQVRQADVAQFCLEMYRRMGLLEGIRIVRSSDPTVRAAACDVPEFFVDVPHEGEVVRARCVNGALQLHAGGEFFVTLPGSTFHKTQVTPTRDTRLRWMQSVLRCTHYVAGAGEQLYLRREETPEIQFVCRDAIERPDEAHTELPG